MTRLPPDDPNATSPNGAWRSVVSPDFFARPAEDVAPDLLGMILRSSIDGQIVTGRIVETEAYAGPDDPASHAARRIGRTDRNRSMFGPPGIAYVYLIYGMHWCLNVVTSRLGDPQAVLVRALEPLEGTGSMAVRRGRNRDLANGPGRLCQALGVTGGLDGHDLTGPPLELRSAVSGPKGRVEVSGRIGIRQARDWPLRFFLEANRHVSRGPHLRIERPRITDPSADLDPPRTRGE